MVACIDIGSNTTRLLVTAIDDGRLSAHDARRAFTAIGPSIDAAGLIPPAKVAEVASVAASMCDTASGLGVERLAVVATAAVRRAVNGHELAAAVEAATGHPVRVLSGDEEAALSFAGACHVLEAGDEPLAVVDVGGGSTEVAVGVPGHGVQWSTSVALGSASLRGAVLDADPPSLAALRRADIHAAEAFAALDPPPAAMVAAVGGTATALLTVAGPKLTHRSLRAGLERICDAPAAEVAPALGLPVERVLLLPAGVTLLCALAERLDSALCVVSGGLREGVALELAGAL